MKKMDVKDHQEARELSEQFPDTGVCGLESSSPIFPCSVKLEAFFCGTDVEKVEKPSSVVLSFEV